MSKSLFKDFSNYRIIVEMRTRYPSDISREQFDQIRALLEGARKKTAPRIADAQSVKNTDTATHKGDEAGKKISGIMLAA